MIKPPKVDPSRQAGGESSHERPRAVVGDQVIDFGNLTKGDQVHREVEIRNEGSAELTLRAGQSSCICTELEILTKKIAPGESGRVRVDFAPEGADSLIVNYVDILTNDPHQERITLTVKCINRALLALRPASLNFGEIGVGEQKSLESLVFTQEIEQFRVEETTSLPTGMEVEVSDATAEEMQPYQAAAGYKIRVRTPETLAKGDFTGKVVVRASGLLRGKPWSETIDLAFGGTARQGLSVRGYDWVVDGLDMGPVRQGLSRKWSFAVKAVGKDELKIEKCVVTPEFLRVTPEVVRPGGKDVGLMRVFVEVPADAPLCDHMGPRAGVLTLQLEDLPLLEAQLRFAVVDEL